MLQRLSGYILGILVLCSVVFSGAYITNSLWRTAPVAQAILVNPGLMASMAAGASSPGLPTADVGSRLQKIVESIWDVLTGIWETSGKIAAKQALKMYLGNLARGTAEWIASGGVGQTPLFHYKDFGAFLQDTTDAAAAEFFDKLGAKYGIDVCNPSLEAKLVIHYGIGDPKLTEYQKPRCTWQQMKDNWAALAPDHKTFLRNFQVAFEPEENDLGIALQLEQQLLVDTNRKKEESILSRLEEQGAKAVKSLNGIIKTPAFTVSEQVKQTLGLSALSESSFIGDPLADAVSIFVNTLGAKLQDKWLKKGLVNVADLYSKASSNQGLFGLGRFASGETQFAALAKVDFGTSGGVDVLSELSACNNPTNPSPISNECVLDSSFRQAIQQKITVREALKQGLLHNNWTFGFKADGQQPTINEGYPYYALVALRTKRIVPVGWELAALAAKKINKTYTLEEVLHCYEDESAVPTDADFASKPVDCRTDINGDGNIDNVNPLFHLVDPNWLLKAPDAYCARRGAGQVLLSETFICDKDTNYDGFIDCDNNDSDPNGSVDIFPDSHDQLNRIIQRADYCADEQSCVAENADGSCKAYGYCFEEKPTFKLGEEECPAQFASCANFISPKGATVSYIRNSLQTCSTGAAGCQWYSTSLVGGGQWSTFSANRIYLNSQATACGNNEVGCNKYLRFSNNMNLIPNGGFEDWDKSSSVSGNDNFYITGSPNAEGQALINSTEVYEGQTSFKLRGGSAIALRVPTGDSVGGRVFTASVASKGCSGNLSLTDDSNNNLGSPVAIQLSSGNDQWHITTLTATAPLSITDQYLKYKLTSLGGSDCYLDALYLTEGNNSSYQAYGSGAAVYLNSNRRQCSEDDVGCRAFTPINGDPIVYGRVSSADFCPQECVGYQQFSYLPTFFEKLEDSSSSGGEASFIPSTGQTCSAVDVGCSQFTNLSVPQQGGETFAYFSKAQQCVTESQSDLATYYTWEGSDTTGYQLRVWRLLKTNLSGDQGPCTNLSLAPSPVCQDTTINRAICSATVNDPDCREIFDSSANNHYMYWSRVIMATNDCQQFRRTGTDYVYHISPARAQTCPAQSAGCRQYRGPTAGNVRTLLRADFEDAQVNGWGNNVALSSESLAVGGHSLMVGGTGVGPVTLTRSVNLPLNPGHQYILTLWVKGTNRNLPSLPISPSSWNNLKKLLGLNNVKSVLAQSSPETLTFTAATSIGTEWQALQLGPLMPTTNATEFNFRVQFNLASGLQNVYVDNLILKEVTSDIFMVANSWNTPLSCDSPTPGAMIGCREYRVSNQSVALRSFTKLCAQNMVGCTALIDTTNSNSPFAQHFNKLCQLGSPATAATPCVAGGYERCIVGAGQSSCRYIATGSYGEDFVDVDEAEDEVIVNEDRLTYYVDDRTAYCQAKAMGCTKLGSPQLNKQVTNGTGNLPNGAVMGWQEVNKIIDPNKFGQILCSQDQLWCQNFTIASGGNLTFKDPQGDSGTTSRLCEYRERIQINDPTPRLISGWFKTGTNNSCSNDGQFSLPTGTDPRREGYVGSCPAVYNSCTRFLDPATYITGGKSRDYYYLRNSVDTSSCNGLVDLAGGCLLFIETGQPLLYNAGASYPPSQLAGQPPSSTSRNNANILIKVQRDRVCNKWYSCSNSLAVTDESGNVKQLCTALTGCDALDPNTNQCLNPGSVIYPVGSVSSIPEFTFMSPNDNDQWRNLSGFTVAGLQFSSPSVVVSRGQSPLSLMDQLGAKLAFDNGNFNNTSDDVNNSGDNGWVSCSGSCQYTTAKGEVLEGAASMKLSRSTVNPADDIVLTHQAVNVSPNSIYVISGWLNTQNFNTTGDMVSIRITTTTVSNIITQGPSQGWQYYLKTFTTDSSTNQLIIDVYSRTKSNGSILVDDIKLEPVLRINSGTDERFVGQQCRIYPRGDAPACEYQRTEGLYRGINGYCIQPDPRDTSKCLQWWPVDLVAGQSADVFSGTTLSLQSPNPLRYCTEAKGNGRNNTYWLQSGWDVVNNAGNTGGTINEHSVNSDPDAWEWDIHWSSLSGIRVTWYTGETGSYVRDIIFLGQLKQWQFSDSKGSVDDYGFYSGQQGPVDSNYHSLFIGVDPISGYLDRFRGWADDGHGEGESAHFHVYFITKEQCSVVAEVVNGNEYVAKFKTFNDRDPVSGLFSPNDDSPPYGALYSDGSDLTTDICDPDVSPSSYGCLLPIGLYSSQQSRLERGGRPLSCANVVAGFSCAPLQCAVDDSNNDFDGPNNRCLTSIDLDNCFGSSGSGYCTGPTSTLTSLTGNRVQGAQRLANLFPMSLKTWVLNPSTGLYNTPNTCPDVARTTTFNDPTTGCWDYRSTGANITDQPKVNNILINSASSVVTVSVDDQVTLKFNSQLDAEHKPLRYIVIDWGDGIVDGADSRLSWDDQPTLDKPHQFIHTYSSTSGLPNCVAPYDTSKKCITINIQLKDNWGICNGSIGGQASKYSDNSCPSGSGNNVILQINPGGGGGGGGYGS